MEKVQSVQQQALQQIENSSSLEELQQIRVTYLGKKGPVQELMMLMKDLKHIL